MTSTLKRLLAQLSFSLMLFSCTGLVWADYAVIVHPDNHSELSDVEIRRIFLIKVKQFPNGKIVQPIDRPEGTEIRKHFVKEIIRTDEYQLRGYLARLLFTGKAVLPKTLENDEDVVKMVSRHPDTIGFVRTESVSDSVRVVRIF